MFLAVQRCAEYTCGSGAMTFSGTIPYAVHLAVTIFKIVVPILLVIFGMVDLGKAVVASKEDEIKKGQQILIKRAITALVIFFVVQIVQILVTFVSDNDESIVGCFKCFINASCGDPTDVSACKTN